MTVEVTRLESGLRVATDRMDSVETVSLGAWVGVGARHEAAEVNGVAHFLEHMVFKGTKARSARDIAEVVEAVGSQIEAYTGRENTAFYAKVLAGDLPLALEVISDMLQNSVFDPQELNRERAVILQEIGQAADTPDDVIFDHFQETAFPGQALGRPVLGRNETVTALSRRSLVDHLTHHYGPDDLVIAAAGRVEHAAFLDMAAEAFDSLPAGGRSEAEPASYVGGEYREARELEQVHLMLGFDGVGYHDPDYYTAAVLSMLFGGGMSSRLFQEVREVRGLAYSIYSFTSAYGDGGLFGVYAGTGEDEAEELLSVVCDEFHKLSRGLEPEEIARAIAQLRAGVLMARESSLSRCERLAHQILVFGRPLGSDEIIARIEAVDEAALLRLSARLLESRPTLAALGPVGRVEPFERLAARLAAGRG